MSVADYRVTIGLETHVQLATQTKIWCGCLARYGNEPNTLVCPVCMGYPGALPVLNEEAVRFTVLAGMLLDCKINRRSKHDRKSYFYPDMPKDYQITQFDQPLCLGGEVAIAVADEAPRLVQLNRIHLEEDVAKSTHFAERSMVDYNRAGTPLMEIVTEADMHSADEVYSYLNALREILVYGGVSPCNMELGQLRCDVNISIAPADSDTLGTKTELKNMNSFRAIHRATLAEVKRQRHEIGAGRPIVQETRRWDEEKGRTESMRSKEEAHDYRYFPDPDLMPIVLDDAYLDAVRLSVPELPAARRARYEADFGLPEQDAALLVGDKAVAAFFEATVAAGADPKMASNWIMTEVLREINERDCALDDLSLTPEGLATIISLIGDGKINHAGGKTVFSTMVDVGGDPLVIIEAAGLAQVSDTGALETFVDEAIAANPKPVEDYRSGNGGALQFLMGQVMKLSRGKAEPKKVMGLLKERIGS